MVLHGAAAPAAAGTGTAAVWVAAIGALSLIAGALIPELFKLLRPRAGEEPTVPPPAVVTVEAYDRLEAQVQDLRAKFAGLRSDHGSLRHEFRRTRDVMEARDRDHTRSLEAVRDDVQQHRWGEHGLVPQPRAPAEGA